MLCSMRQGGAGLFEHLRCQQLAPSPLVEREASSSRHTVSKHTRGYKHTAASAAGTSGYDCCSSCTNGVCGGADAVSGDGQQRAPESRPCAGWRTQEHWRQRLQPAARPASRAPHAPAQRSPPPLPPTTTTPATHLPARALDVHRQHPQRRQPGVLSLRRVADQVVHVHVRLHLAVGGACAALQLVLACGVGGGG